MFPDIVEIKPKCRGSQNKFLIQFLIDGASSIFSDGAILLFRKVAKIGRKSDFAKRSA